MFLIRRLTAPPPEPDASPASEFDRHLAPSIWQPHTRADYWWAWRLVAMWRLGAFLLALGAVLSTSPRR
jgi:hypothetical protein